MKAIKVKVKEKEREREREIQARNNKVSIFDDIKLITMSSQIKKAQQFMITNEMIIETNKYKLENDKLDSDVSKKLSFSFTAPIKVNNPLAILPTQPDTLFWSFFIVTRGVSEYYKQGHHTFAYEKQLKFQYVEQFQKEKELLKTFKISLTEIENQLANDSVIQLKTFFCLCALEKINIVYFNNNTYYESITESTEVHVLEKIPCSYSKTKKNKPIYEYLGTINNEDLNVRRSVCFKLESLDKPLKCISSYKVTEVEDICKLFKINIFTDEINVESNKNKNKKRNKTELFHYLQKYLEIIK